MAERLRRRRNHRLERASNDHERLHKAMTTTNPYPHLPVPAGADEVSEWADAGRPDASRQFIASRRVIDFDLGENFSRPWTADIEVRVEGIQYVDGRIRREIVIDTSDGPITLEHSEQLAAALIEAARAATAANQLDGLVASRR
jgi:hypothetical protein